MKFIIYIFISSLLFSACTSSESKSQTVVFMTQAALPSVTPTPLPTATSTTTPTKTSIPTKKPTLVPKGNNYILETGVCIVLFGQKIAGNPINSPECSLSSRKTISLLPNMSIIMTSDPGSSSIQMFCSLYKIDETLIMSDLDAGGIGKVECHP